MCPQSEVYKKSVATCVLAVRVRVENGCTVRTRRFLLSHEIMWVCISCHMNTRHMKSCGYAVSCYIKTCHKISGHWQWAAVLYVKRLALLRVDLGAVWERSALRSVIGSSIASVFHFPFYQLLH